MKNKISKTEAEKEINEFFSNIKSKSLRDIKKIKRVAMKHNIPLKEKRRLFCKKCLNPFAGNEKIRIKNGLKSIICKKCDYVNRLRISSS